MELYNNGSMHAELCDQMRESLPEAADGSEGKRPRKARIPSRGTEQPDAGDDVVY